MRTFLSLISLWGADDVSGPIFGLCPNTWTGSYISTHEEDYKVLYKLINLLF